jgi:hypothetical protein
MWLDVILQTTGCRMLSQQLLIEIVGYITNYDMFLYVILHSTGYHCVLSQTTRCHCTLSHKTLVIIVCYLTNNGCHSLLSHKLPNVCYKLLDIILCYLTNSWMLLLVTSQTDGCRILSHELLNIIVGYLTNY